MRCGINPEKCVFASNMQDRPNSRCLKYEDAADCPKWLRQRRKQSKHSKQESIKEKINNYDFTKKVQQYLKRKNDSTL